MKTTMFKIAFVLLMSFTMIQSSEAYGRYYARCAPRAYCAPHYYGYAPRYYGYVPRYYAPVRVVAPYYGAVVVPRYGARVYARPYYR